MKALALAVFVGLLGLIAADGGLRISRSQPPPEILGPLVHSSKNHTGEDGLHKTRAGRSVAASSDQTAQVLRSESEVKPDSFHYEFETDNGISAQASGTMQKVPEGEALVIQGQYQYKAPDGTDVQITYTANENGYHAEGPLIPTPAPIPEYIQRSLEYIEKHPPPPEPVRKP